MNTPWRLNALQVAGIARDLAMASHPTALAKQFLAIFGAQVEIGICYRLNASGDQLLPLAYTSGDETVLPDIAMDEMDNPLVYSLVSGQPCNVERLDALVDIGASFDRLREQLPARLGALIWPLHDTNRYAFALLMLVGSTTVLNKMRHDPLWQILSQFHERLFANLRANQISTDAVRRANDNCIATDMRARERSARLLATEFVGISPAVQGLRTEMLRLTDSALSILITGETGVGKDHAAWLIHQAGRRQGKFVPVNCAAIPKDLIEAELFGSTRGAFTGATQARSGLVAEADGGTLFLDEIGDMPPSLQTRLLRLLNEKKYRPLGATQERSSNFRLICATHQPLRQRIADGHFREDLYFRIRQQTLHVPPLRERREDIPVLVEHILLRLNRERQTHISGISHDALRLLRMHPFRGNVRELRNVVLVAAEQTENGHPIDTPTVQALLSDWIADLSYSEMIDAPLKDLWETDDLPGALATFERRLIDARLRQWDGSRSRAAVSLGIPKRTLARKCLQWNLDSNREDSNR